MDPCRLHIRRAIESLWYDRAGRKHEVVLGICDDMNGEVLKGVVEGDTIVVSREELGTRNAHRSLLAAPGRSRSWTRSRKPTLKPGLSSETELSQDQLYRIWAIFANRSYMQPPRATDPTSCRSSATLRAPVQRKIRKRGLRWLLRHGRVPAADPQVPVAE